MSTSATLIANVAFIFVAVGLTALAMWLPSALVATGGRPGAGRRRVPARRRGPQIHGRAPPCREGGARTLRATRRLPLDLGRCVL
jgi:hypothetical protein